MTLEKVRFLVVDDNVHMLEIVKTILRSFGAVMVFEANDAAVALVRMKRDPVDIIILDYQMGEEDGVAFVRRLRTSPDSPAPYIPVIMLTAHADKTRVEAARDAGVNEFCTKPVTATEMMRKVSAVVNNPRPFVRCATYFGPDRRRKDDPKYEGEERRTPMDDVAVGDAARAER